MSQRRRWANDARGLIVHPRRLLSQADNHLSEFDRRLGRLVMPKPSMCDCRLGKSSLLPRVIFHRFQSGQTYTLDMRALHNLLVTGSESDGAAATRFLCPSKWRLY